MLPQEKRPTLKEEQQAVNRIVKWSNDDEAFQTVAKIESAKLNGEIYQPTQKDIKVLTRSVLRGFLDGNCSNKMKNTLIASGLNPENLRQSLIEETLTNALPQIVGQGDIERLMNLATLAGEKPDDDIPQNAKKIIRERVEIIIDD
jgi:hypothetical protein